MKRLAIIGGGITALAAAYRMNTLSPEVEVILFEREERLGGKILTHRSNGYIIEGGADSFLSCKQPAISLCDSLGISRALQGRRPKHDRTYVKFRGQLHPLPGGLTGTAPARLDALSESTLLTAEARARVKLDFELSPKLEDSDESVAAFVSRRLGRQVYDRIMEPLMASIYGGDGEQLSLAATFPNLRALELSHGSLIKGLLAHKSTGVSHKYPPFVSFPSGMGKLVKQLHAALTRTTVLTGAAVNSLERSVAADARLSGSDQSRTGWTIRLQNGRRARFDAVIVTTPAYVTAALLASLDSALAEIHASIPYASSSIVTLAYEAAATLSFEGYGYVIPRIEESDVLACTVTSNKWAGRAPDGSLLVRLYFGRYGRRDVCELTDGELLEIARGELQETLRITSPPLFHRIHRWPRAMPQYTMGHTQRVAWIETRLENHSGLEVAGAAYKGVGIPDCIASGTAAAERAKVFLQAT